MLNSFSNLTELLDYFRDETVCMQQLEKWRWGNTITCPHCKHERVYKVTKGYKCASNKCYKKFSVLVGSIFENTKVPLRLWFAAIYLCTSHKKGISSLQLSRDIGVTQKTAWFMLHRIRKMLSEVSPEKIGGTIEVDETFIGGKNKNRHADKKVKNSQGRTYIDKTPVLGILQHGGIVRCIVLKNTSAQTIRPLLLDNVKFLSNLYTDEWSAYYSLDRLYNHKVVDHSRGQYTNEEATTNRIENFWSILKRGIIGIYHYVELYRYK